MSLIKGVLCLASCEHLKSWTRQISPPSSGEGPCRAPHTAPWTSHPLESKRHTHQQEEKIAVCAEDILHHAVIKTFSFLSCSKCRDDKRWRTCQPERAKDAEANGEQREGVNEVHTEVEDALEQHHHQPQLHNTATHKGLKTKPKLETHGGVMD